jgi:FkbM family methyltransferase
MSIRRILTTTLIKLGPRNPMVLALVNSRCRKFGAALTIDGDVLKLQKDRRAMLLALKHFVYAPDMAERFDVYFSPLVPTKKGDCMVIDYSRPGVLQTYARSGLQFEMASFPEEDETIEDYFHWYRPAAGETVFDIGAHCGVSTYHFSKLVGPAGRVISFEPDPVNHSLLLRNIARHGLTNVTTTNVAIAGSRGKAEFNSEGTIGSSLIRHTSRASVGTVTTVDTITLADAFEKWGTPAFCKIDIEGAELEVISAAREALATRNCQFAIDTNHLVHGSLTNKAVEQLFSSCGYEAASAETGMMTTWARPAQVA